MGALAVVEVAEEVVDGEVLAGRSLLLEALRFARLQNSKETQRSYASVYRTFSNYVGPASTVEALTPESLASYRDWLVNDMKRLPRTVAHHLSALKQLGVALGVEDLRSVKGPRPQRPTPRALSNAQVLHLFGALELDTLKGKRDHAILLLMLDAGLRRSEVAQLVGADVVNVARASSPKARRMVKQPTQWWIKVRGKGGKEREVPLTARTVKAIRAWGRARPDSEHDELFLSLKPGGAPRPLDGSAIWKMVEEYARTVDLPLELRSPHMLRHTFCTRLVDAGENLADVADLAGHASVTTTAGYVKASRERQLKAIQALEPKQGLEALLAS